MINLLNLNIYKIFHFCPHMIFDQILNGTPIFFPSLKTCEPMNFFFACQYHWECRKSSEKDWEHTVFILRTSTCGCPPMMTEVFKNGTNHEKASRPSNFGHIFKKKLFVVISGQYFIQF